jgi:hypothetical protein
MNEDMEKYLGRFKLPEAPAGLRQKVLNSAQAYRQQRQETELSATFAFGVKIFLSAAAIILVSVIALNSLSFSRPEPDMKKYEEAIEQVTQLGIPRETAAIMVAIKATRKPDTIQIYSIKGDVL